MLIGKKEEELPNGCITFLWVSRGELKAETESEITAAQDHATKILQTETDSKWGLPTI